MHRTRIDAAHPTAQVLKAATALGTETMGKVKPGFTNLVTWDDIQDQPPKQSLKGSPIAQLPAGLLPEDPHGPDTGSHRLGGPLYRTSPRSSHSLAGRNHGKRGIRLRQATHMDVCSHPAALDQLGQVFPRLFGMFAWAPQAQGPLMFQKLDIKDGYWRGVVEQGGESATSSRNSTTMSPPNS